MPPKKAVKQPSRQLTKTAPPARRRVAGTAGTLDLAETEPGGAPAADELAAAPAARPVPAPRPTPAAAPRAVPATRPVPAARRTPAPTSASAASGLRAMRGRVAQQIQGMDLRDEMAWIRSDVARLTVLAAAGFVILIVLAIVLPMFNL